MNHRTRRRLLLNARRIRTTSSRHIFFEVFSPERVGSALKQVEPFETHSFDLTSGCDLLQAEQQHRLWQRLEKEKPIVVGLSPPCTMFSSLQRCGKHRTDLISLQIRKKRMEKAIKMLNLCAYQDC